MPELNGLINRELADNWSLFRDINGLAGHNATLDSIMIFSANDLIFALPLLAALLWLLVARWSPYQRWMRGRFGANLSDRARWIIQRVVISAAFASVVALLLNLLIGNLIYEPRPFVSHPGAVDLLIPHPADASFPSDHEAVSMAIALALVFGAFWLLSAALREPLRGAAAGWTWGRALRLIALPALIALTALGCAALIGFARVYDGVHYPHDIVGGALCALVGVSTAYLLARPLNALYRIIVSLAAWLRLA